MIDISTIQAERKKVAEATVNLEQQITQMTAQLQQAQQSLIANRGVLAGFDHLISLNNRKPEADVVPLPEPSPAQS